MASLHDQDEYENGTTSTTAMEPSSPENSMSSQLDNRLQVVIWLRENYRLGEQGALRKSYVYQHYLEACRETGLIGTPISHTYFGKLVRRAFAGIKCQRKGPRGDAHQCYSLLERLARPQQLSPRQVEQLSDEMARSPSTFSASSSPASSRAFSPLRPKESSVHSSPSDISSPEQHHSADGIARDESSYSSTPQDSPCSCCSTYTSTSSSVDYSSSGSYCCSPASASPHHQQMPWHAGHKHEEEHQHYAQHGSNYTGVGLYRVFHGEEEVKEEPGSEELEHSPRGRLPQMRFAAEPMHSASPSWPHARQQGYAGNWYSPLQTSAAPLPMPMQMPVPLQFFSSSPYPNLNGEDDGTEEISFAEFLAATSTMPTIHQTLQHMPSAAYHHQMYSSAAEGHPAPTTTTTTSSSSVQQQTTPFAQSVEESGWIATAIAPSEPCGRKMPLAWAPQPWSESIY